VADGVSLVMLRAGTKLILALDDAPATFSLKAVVSNVVALGVEFLGRDSICFGELIVLLRLFVLDDY
jgi:hypothetical protein